MNVLIVMPLGEQRGGGEMMLLDLLEHGRGLGITWFAIFLESGSMVTQVQNLGIETRVIEAGQLRQLGKWWSTVQEICQVVKARSIDAIVGWMWKGHLYTGIAAQLCKIPEVWYQLENPQELTVLKRLANRLPTKAVITLSKSGQIAQSKLTPQYPVELVYPGADLDRFKAENLASVPETRQKLGLPTDVPIIGIIGRLQRWKGMHVLVEAMPKILEKYPNTQCLIVGGQHHFEAEYQDYVKQRINDLNVSDNIQMIGLQKNVPEWMQAMDVIVHASDHEPFGIVVVEAMSMGKPIVASASGGPTEIITPGVNGLLAPYGDTEQLASSVMTYLDDRDYAEQLGREAKIRANEFSTPTYAKNFITVLSHVVESES
jgi:glycosyltransferase involved in cell wall biosynthesis